MDEEYRIIQPALEVGLIEETTDFTNFNDEESEGYQRWYINSNQ